MNNHTPVARLYLALCLAFPQCAFVCGATFVVTPDKPEVPAALKPGDTVIFKNGLYKKKFAFENLAGSSNAPIVIKSETPGGAVFDGSEPISLSWSKKKSAYVAVSAVHPHALYRDSAFIRHLADAANLKPGAYNVSGAGPWTITYLPLAGEDVPSLKFSRGVMESAFSLKNCSFVVLEGLKIRNFGLQDPPANQFGITRFGAAVVGLDECRNVVVRGLTVDGFFGAGIAIRRCNDTTAQDSVVKNGYGAGLSFTSDVAMLDPVYRTCNNAAKGCVLSNIYRFNKSQAGYSTKGIAVNGNQIRDTVIDSCVFHSIPQTAIHFDVRSGFATVKNCLFYNNGSNRGGMEIHIENRIHDVLIENNVFANSHYASAIQYGRCWNIVLRNNTFYRTCGCALVLESAYSFSILDNLFYMPDAPCMKISEQALAGKKVERGLVVCDGRQLYNAIKHSNPNIPPKEMNARLQWAGVAPLNPDGSEPDDITWKSRAEVEKAGRRAISARDNPNGNGIDMDPPNEIKNVIRGNIWYSQGRAPFTVYRPPKNGIGREAVAEELKKTNPQWDCSGGFDKPSFADEGAHDLRTPAKGVGANDEMLAWAREQLARIGRQ